MEGLRQEVYTLQRELLQDRTKVKALSEELENPDNTYGQSPSSTFLSLPSCCHSNVANLAVLQPLSYVIALI